MSCGYYDEIIYHFELFFYIGKTNIEFTLKKTCIKKFF